MYRPILILFIALALSACGSNGASKRADREAPANEVGGTQPAFDADSAFAFVKAQVDFGPRVPNTQAHQRCGDWLVEKLKQYGATDITEQQTQLTAYDGTTLDVRNISGRFNAEAAKRILLLSHWDSRPWADRDPDPTRRSQPIDGANDGASGVGVILEIARNLSQTQAKTGVDVLFVDAEDYGTRADDPKQTDDEDTWCLGSQYWAQSPTIEPREIRYAVLLDMVGGKDAVFPREYISEYSSKHINDMIWSAASAAGYGTYFVDQTGIPIIDDHVPLIKAGIPTVDIIETMHPKTHGFNPTWHTHADNIDNIDKNTLKAVGQTLINIIYE